MITKTPERQVRTSTPNISPPRSNIILDEVFINPPPPPVPLLGFMEAQEDSITRKINNLQTELEFHDPEILSEHDLDNFKEDLNKGMDILVLSTEFYICPGL